jgi:hypothetical protein
MIVDPAAPILVVMSVLHGLVVFISLMVGKAPYRTFLGRSFIVRRKWDPAHYWATVSYCSVVSLSCALLATYFKFRH